MQDILLQICLEALCSMQKRAATSEIIDIDTTTACVSHMSD